MCLNPRKILNPSLSWHEGMPKYIITQCNNCSECRARNQQEWFLRACAEYRKNRHGSNFFVTLTFRDEDLPYFTDARNYEFKTKTEIFECDDNGKIINRPVISDDNQEKVKIDSHLHILKRPVRVEKHVFFYLPVFDGDMLTDFQKKFRTYLSRSFPNYDTSGVKFFICPEYGEHTRRQHFHCDIHVPFFLPVSIFKDICRRSWTHGWIGASKNKGFLIRSEAAFQYTCKYVNKDLYYYNEGLKKYLDKETLDEFEYEYRYNKIKKYLPRLRVSKGYGSSIAKDIMSRQNPLEYCCCEKPITKFNKSGKYVQMPIPRYILSLLTRKVDKLASKISGKVIYTYTEFGEKLRKERFLAQFDLDKQRLSYFNKQFILDTLPRSSQHMDNFIRMHIANKLPKLLGDLKLQNVTFYRKFLRFLPVSAYGKHTAFWYNRRFEEIIDDYFGYKTIPFWIKKSRIENCPFLPKDSIFRNAHSVGFSLNDFNSNEVQTLSQLGEFRRYEECAKLIELYNSIHSLKRSKVLDKRNKRVDEVRAQCVEYLEYESQAFA